MWIEFLGAPGVGKTTLQRAILDSDSSLVGAPWPQEDVVPEHYEEVYRRVYELYEDYCISGSRTAMRMRKLRILLNRIGRAEENPEQVHVFDESMAMSAQAASYDFRHDTQSVACVAELLPKGDALIHCTAPKDVIVNRNISRGMMGGHDRSGNALDVLEHGELIEFIWSSYGVPIARVSTDLPLDSQVSVVKWSSGCLR